MKTTSPSKNDLITEEEAEQYIEYKSQLDFVTDKLSTISEKIRNGMNSVGQGQTVIVHDILKVSLGVDTVSATLDVTKIEMEDPELYAKLMLRFGKATTRKGAFRITKID